MQDAVEAGDVRTSGAVLKGLGLLLGTGVRVGSSDAKKLQMLAGQQAQTDKLLASLASLEP